MDDNHKDKTFLENVWNDIKASAWLDVEDSTSTVGDLWQCHGWRNFHPLLRLIHVITDDRMKIWFQRRDEQLSRLEKDAVNTEKAKPNFWQKCVEMFNDTDFKPKSMVLDHTWGEYWETSHDLTCVEFNKCGMG